MAKTSAEVKNRWNEKHYDRITITTKKGEKARWMQAATDEGKSLSEFVRDIMNNALKIKSTDDKI